MTDGHPSGWHDWVVQATGLLSRRVVYPLAAQVLSAADYLRIMAVAVAAVPVYLLAVFFLSFNRTERLWIRSALPTRSW